MTRQQQALTHIEHRYPGCWGLYDKFLQGRGRDLPAWPAWCYCPMAAAYSIVTAASGPMGDIAILAALAAWRPTQGIYRYDATVAEAVCRTDFDRELPWSAYYRLPEWCVYVEIPSPRPTDITEDIVGYYAHLEYDSNTGHAELRLLWDSTAGLMPTVLHERPTVLEAITATEQDAQEQTRLAGVPWLARPGATEALAAAMPPYLALLLYLCADSADVADRSGTPTGGEPRRPQPKQTKRGPRLFAPPRPEVYEVGFRLGKRIREYERTESAGTHASPRAHIRRAHWHTFLAGPLDKKRERRVRWLPPIPVNIGGDDDIRPTIHNVKED